MQLGAMGNVESLANSDLGQMFGTDEATGIFQNAAGTGAYTMND